MCSMIPSLTLCPSLRLLRRRFSTDLGTPYVPSNPSEPATETDFTVQSSASARHLSIWPTTVPTSVRSTISSLPSLGLVNLIESALLKMTIGALLRQFWLQISSTSTWFEHEQTPRTSERVPGSPLHASSHSLAETHEPSGPLAPPPLALQFS